MKRRLPPLAVLFLLCLLPPTALFSLRASHRVGAGAPAVPSWSFFSGPLVDNAQNATVLLSLAVQDAGEAALLKEAENLLDATISSFDAASRLYRLLYLRPGPNYSMVTASATKRTQWKPRVLARLRLPLLPRPPPTDAVLLSVFRHNLAGWLSSSQSQGHRLVMPELLDLVKRRLDQHAGGDSLSGHRYSSCAVVGNSGILLHSSYGPDIDAHDAVIRINNARIAGFDKDVGVRTTLSFVNSNILHLCTLAPGCACHPYGHAVPIVMYICQPAHWLDFAVCNASHQSPLLVTDRRLDALCAHITKYYSLQRFVLETGRRPEEWANLHDENFHYSSGLQAIVLALGICERVSAFGFGKASDAKHHYHTTQKAELSLHDYSAEYAFYRDLESRPQDIPFLRDESFQVPPVVFYR